MNGWLSPRDEAIINTVNVFRQVTSEQIRRLHFADGYEPTQGAKQRRRCARLVKLGHIRRLPIGYHDGGYVYTPGGTTTGDRKRHTLDITELYVRLVEASMSGSMSGLELLAFDPEPYCHVQLGHIELKPDAYVRLANGQGTFRYWIEVDRGTEWRPQLSAKMRRYVQAYNHWTEPTYPQVLFLVPDELRLRFVEGVIKRQEAPALFDVRLVEAGIHHFRC